MLYYGNVLEDNARYLELAQKYDVNYVLIDNKYEINIDLEKSRCQ